MSGAESPAQPAPAEPAPAQSGPAEPVRDLDPRKGLALFVGLSVLVAAAVLLGLRVGVGVDFDSPTWALALACIAMIWALRAMWGMVTALARPTVQTMIVEAERGATHSTQAELRDEKRRVLRAIKELEFDHAMGKLSDEDFAEVGDRYRLRAIEVMRKLDRSGELHPDLIEHLAAVGVELDTIGVSAELDGAVSGREPEAVGAVGEGSPA